MQSAVEKLDQQIEMFEKKIENLETVISSSSKRKREYKSKHAELVAQRKIAELQEWSDYFDNTGISLRDLDKEMVKEIIEEVRARFHKTDEPLSEGDEKHLADDMPETFAENDANGESDSVDVELGASSSEESGSALIGETENFPPIESTNGVQSSAEISGNENFELNDSDSLSAEREKFFDSERPRGDDEKNSGDVLFAGKKSRAPDRRDRKRNSHSERWTDN